MRALFLFFYILAMAMVAATRTTKATMLVRVIKAEGPLASYAVGQTVSVDEAEGAELVASGAAYDTMAPIHRTSDLNPDIRFDTTKAGTQVWEARTGGLATSSQQVVQTLESSTGSQSTTGAAVPAESPPPSGSTVGEEALDSAAAPRSEGTTLSQSTDLGGASTTLTSGEPGESGESRTAEEANQP